MAHLLHKIAFVVFVGLRVVYDKIIGVHAIHAKFPEEACGNADKKEEIGFGSVIFAVKPGDGSAREQAASCQKVLGGWANIAGEYATKRYRSNLINWGMLPFILDEGIPFENGDYIFVPHIAEAVRDKKSEMPAYIIGKEVKPFTLKMGDLTDDERKIILSGCLINYYR